MQVAGFAAYDGLTPDELHQSERETALAPLPGPRCPPRRPPSHDYHDRIHKRI